MNEIDISRFKIEPRCGYYDQKCWLVVFDKQKGEYLTEGHHKKQICFKSSDEIIKYFKNFVSENVS